VTLADTGTSFPYILLIGPGARAAIEVRHAIASRIAEAHGGRIEIENADAQQPSPPAPPLPSFLPSLRPQLWLIPLYQQGRGLFWLFSA
jgi:hypothetical protein